MNEAFTYEKGSMILTGLHLPNLGTPWMTVTDRLKGNKREGRGNRDAIVIIPDTHPCHAWTKCTQMLLSWTGRAHTEAQCCPS